MPKRGTALQTNTQLSYEKGHNNSAHGITKEAVMRCFRVTEKAVVGIHLTTSTDGLCIKVGDKQVHLRSTLSKQLEAARKMVLERLLECHSAQKFMGEALTQEELEEIEDRMEQIREETIILIHADVREKTIIWEKTYSPNALVLIETAPGVGGKITFKSTTFSEHIDQQSNRVYRRYREEFPPPGIQVIEEGKGEEGGRCFLLCMMPSSSFRMERTGNLNNAPSVLTVVWKGQKGVAGVQPLLVFCPSGYRGPEARLEQ